MNQKKSENLSPATQAESLKLGECVPFFTLCNPSLIILRDSRDITCKTEVEVYLSV